MILLDRIPTFRGGLLILSVCFLAACSFDTSLVVPAHIEASPTYICPCEAVTVDWSCAKRGDDTFYCDSITVRSSNPLVLNPPVGPSPRETHGRRELPVVCETTGLFMEIEYEGRAETHTTPIIVIPEGTPLTTPYNLQPKCSGAVVVWEPLPLKDLNSSCIGVTNFCNGSGSMIRVTPEGGSAILVPTGCTPAFNGPSKNLTVAPATVPAIPDGGACGPERRLDLLDPIRVSVTTECNRDLEDCDL